MAKAKQNSKDKLNPRDRQGQPKRNDPDSLPVEIPGRKRGTYVKSQETREFVSDRLF